MRRWHEEHYRDDGSVQRVWAVVDDESKAAAHLHILFLDDWRGGGIEFHSSKRPDWANSDKPDHDSCWLLNGPCWHDGSALQVDELFLPLIDAGLSNRAICEHVEGWLARQVKSRLEDDE